MRKIGSTRRQFLAATSAAFVAAAVPAGAGELESLRARAARKGIAFGSQVNLKQLEADPDFAAAIVRDCAIIVPENEMKWGYVERRRGFPDYRDADRIASFAARNNLLLRGHTAVWHVNPPSWISGELDTPDGETALIRRTKDVVGHFRGRIAEWDVVNEAIEPRDGLASGLRKWPAFANGDIGYIVDCFQAAREADPAASLTYNDFGFEYEFGDYLARRAAAIKFMTALRERNAPVDRFGIQCHLTAGNAFDAGAFAAFLQAIADTGVKISLTELDVSDRRISSADIARRDRAVADHARAFLDCALAQKAVTTVLTWGFTDSHTWLSKAQHRKDGLPLRPLPLDDRLARKPLWQAIAASLDGAENRQA